MLKSLYERWLCWWHAICYRHREPLDLGKSCPGCFREHQAKQKALYARLGVKWRP